MHRLIPSLVLLSGILTALRRRRGLAGAEILAAVVGISCADRAHAATIDMVTVGNPGNAADSRYVDAYRPNSVGAVNYAFRIGATEITNTQYAAFLNAVAADDAYGIYNEGMGSTRWGGITRSGSPGSYSYAVKPTIPGPVGGGGPGGGEGESGPGGDYNYGILPVVLVSWGDAVRLANWLHNNQPTGPQNGATTEDGAYTLNGAVSDAALAAVTRNAAARWWLPNEDEWYKAAYYDPSHGGPGMGGYWDYATGTDNVPDNNLPSNDTGNSANHGAWGSYGYPLTEAGAYLLSSSPYGTFDQSGNVEEWNETLFDGANRGIRGGYYFSASSPGFGYSVNPTSKALYRGFRVASMAVPEPSAVLLFAFGTLGALCVRRGPRRSY